MKKETTVAATCHTIEKNHNYRLPTWSFFSGPAELLDLVADRQALNTLLLNKESYILKHSDGYKVNPKFAQLARHNPPKEALLIYQENAEAFSDFADYDAIRASAALYIVYIAGFFQLPAYKKNPNYQLKAELGVKEWMVQYMALSVLSNGDMKVFQKNPAEVYTPERLLNWECLHTQLSQQEQVGKGCHYPLM